MKRRSWNADTDLNTDPNYTTKLTPEDLERIRNDVNELEWIGLLPKPRQPDTADSPWGRSIGDGRKAR
jgi:hypothetical protein